MTFFEQLQAETASARQALFSIPVIQDAIQGRIQRSQYVAFLTQAYHHVKHTVPLLMACGSRLPERLDWLRRATADYIEEEIGHEQWILSDISACGADAESVRNGPAGFETRMMLAYAYHQIDRHNPVGFFGMVHVLEGTSVALASRAAATLQATLDLPAGAFSYLSSHGSLDVDHVATFAGLMNRLTEPGDRAAVIECSKAIYQLYGGIFRALPQAELPMTAEAR